MTGAATNCMAARCSWFQHLFPIHQVVALGLYRVLDEYARKTGGFALASPMDIVFSDYDVLQPDVVFFDAERRRRIDLQSAIRIVPSLVVEVLSRSTAARDRGRKRDVFADYDVPEYWIVDPTPRTLEILQNSGGRFEQVAAFDDDSTVTAATIEGLTFKLADIFRV